MRTEILQMATSRSGPAGPRVAQRRSQGQPAAGTARLKTGPPAAAPEQHPRPGNRQRATPSQSKPARRGRTHDPNRGRRARPRSSSRQFDLMNDTEGYGYPKGSRVYKINMQQALLLAHHECPLLSIQSGAGLPGRAPGDAAAIYLRAPVLRGHESAHGSADREHRRSFGRRSRRRRA